MPTDKVKFVLTKTSDVEFQKALKRRKEDFPNHVVVDIKRETKTMNGVKVPIGVIVLKI